MCCRVRPGLFSMNSPAVLRCLNIQSTKSRTSTSVPWNTAICPEGVSFKSKGGFRFRDMASMLAGLVGICALRSQAFLRLCPWCQERMPVDVSSFWYLSLRHFPRTAQDHAGTGAAGIEVAGVQIYNSEQTEISQQVLTSQPQAEN